MKERILAPSVFLASAFLVISGCGSQKPKEASTPTAAVESGASKPDPYANNNGDQLPPDYRGPRYALNHSYPSTPPKPPVDPPWQKALGGKPIGKTNAIAYAQALKDYISADVKTLVNDYTKWDPVKTGWYDQPWIAQKVPGKKRSWPGREPIQGSYPGPNFNKATYPDLKVANMQDYVIVYYDKTAAYTLHEMWQKPDPMQPQPGNGQFAEGSLIIKLAVTNVSGKDWPPMEGAAQSAVFVPDPLATQPGPPVVLPVYAMQMDIIVKDSKTAPKTGWVFTTLVYDKSAPGATPWDKMIPLGAGWGNDPGVADANLKENYINPKAPAYSTITLGWNGRLSGPNDAAASPANGNSGPLVHSSSCMSCHGTAEYPGKAPLVAPMSPPTPPIPSDSPWWQWWQDKPGTQPQTSGPEYVALDYDMVSRQAFLNWKALTGTAEDKARLERHIEMLRNRGHRVAE